MAGNRGNPTLAGVGKNIVFFAMSFEVATFIDEFPDEPLSVQILTSISFIATLT
jgi:hypothetical protein